MKPKIPLREIKRKAIHVLFGIVFLLLIAITGTRTSLEIIFACLVIGVIVSFLIKKGFSFGFIGKIVEKVERENEKNFPGKAAVYFFASAIILLGIFPNEPTLVLACLSVQIFADASAAIIGMTFGKHKLYKKKTWEGSTACLIVATICLAFFYPLPTAIIGAIVATLVEVLPLDDNLWVPIITAATLKALI
ncbi:MAG: phosphatidate cytidylyltransferase [archaeon]